MLLSDTAKSLSLPMLLCKEENVEGRGTGHGRWGLRCFSQSSQHRGYHCFWEGQHLWTGKITHQTDYSGGGTDL